MGMGEMMLFEGPIPDLHVGRAITEDSWVQERWHCLQRCLHVGWPEAKGCEFALFDTSKGIIFQQSNYRSECSYHRRRVDGGNNEKPKTGFLGLGGRKNKAYCWAFTENPANNRTK